MLKTVFKKSDNKELSHSKIGSKILNMLEFASQSIACDFATSQERYIGTSHRRCTASHRVAGPYIAGASERPIAGVQCTASHRAAGPYIA